MNQSLGIMAAKSRKNSLGSGVSLPRAYRRTQGQIRIPFLVTFCGQLSGN